MKNDNVKLFNKLVKNIQDKIILVEGKNDERALKLLGCNIVIKVASKKIHKIIEEVKEYKEKEIVILTDFDRNGEKMAKEFENELRAYFKVSNLRKDFLKVFGIKKIEELNLKKINEICGDDYGESLFGYNKICNKSESGDKWPS